MWPRWITSSYPSKANLREVAPRLFVGGMDAPKKGRWDLVVDLYGQSLDPMHSRKYRDVGAVLAIPFEDGTPFPIGALDQISFETKRVRRGNGVVLLHCAAGLSRSASAAYAMLRADGLDHGEALRRIQLDQFEDDYPLPVTIDSARLWAEQRGRR